MEVITRVEILLLFDADNFATQLSDTERTLINWQMTQRQDIREGREMRET